MAKEKTDVVIPRLQKGRHQKYINMAVFFFSIINSEQR